MQVPIEIGSHHSSKFCLFNFWLHHHGRCFTEVAPGRANANVFFQFVRRDEEKLISLKFAQEGEEEVKVEIWPTTSTTSSQCQVEKFKTMTANLSLSLLQTSDSQTVGRKSLGAPFCRLLSKSTTSLLVSMELFS